MTAPDDSSMCYSIYKIDMPEPEGSSLCRRVYIGLRKISYYNVERDPQNLSFICGCDSNGSRLNYGLLPETEEEELLQI